MRAAMAAACCVWLLVADAVASPDGKFHLGPPAREGPVVVRVRFDLRDVNRIDDAAEAFEFSGVLILEWRDPRRAFDPAAAGVDEKVFQGDYQLDEVSTAWYPQLVLVNQTGLYQRSGVLLRVLPDGTSTLVQTINAAAESDFDMRRFPFDRQRLEARFEVLGFDRDSVRLEIAPPADWVGSDEIRIPEWALEDVSAQVEQRRTLHAAPRGIASTFVVGLDLQRRSWYERRLVVLPLIIIVLLSFSVFWMDRSSLGDRLSVSFIGVLTAVTYQLFTTDQLPRIAYGTLMNGFLNLSFLTVCSTVVVNLVVGSADKRGRADLGDRIDLRCRWIFPMVYFGLILAMLGAEYLPV